MKINKVGMLKNYFKPQIAFIVVLMLLMPKVGFAQKVANPAIQAVVDSVSLTHYRAYHIYVESMGLGLYGGSKYNQGYRNRDANEGIGSLGNQETRIFLQDKLRDMGLKVTVQGKHLNVVAELTGTKTPEKIFIIAGHYDHIEGDRPGGVDNASGTTGMLEAARVLSQFRFESTIRFIGFNAEEDGLAGSKDYVNSIVIPGEENIVGMINMDMILRPGSDVEPDNIIDAELEVQRKHPPSLAWAEAYQEAAAIYVPSMIVADSIVETPSTSDNDSFLNNGYPAFLVIENSWPDFSDADPYWHDFDDASDRLANDPNTPSGVTYNYDFARDIVRGITALVAQEAKLVTGSSKPANDN
jgi:hypothetical protein